MGGMAVHKMGHVEQFPDLFGCGGGLYAKDHIRRLSCSHMMAAGTNAANLGHDLGYLFDRPAFAEFFKAAQFGNLEIYILNFAVVIAEYFDLAMPFKACYGIYSVFVS